MDLPEVELSTGVLDKIFDGEEHDEPILLQFLKYKPVCNDRFRLWLSDGVKVTSYTIMSNEKNHLIVEGSLADFAVCRITNYVLTKSKNTTMPIMYIKELEVLVPGSEIGEQIGNPADFEPRLKNSNPVDQNSEDNRTQNFENNPDTDVDNENGVLEQIQVQMQPPVPEEYIHTVPITSLSPYYGVWTIRARVTAKSEIRYWNNVRGEGKLFSMNLIDESGEIRCTGFKEQVDAFYDTLEEGSIYYITRCQVKVADKRFTTIKHEFELVLNADSAIMRYNGDSAQIPMIEFNFSSINLIEMKEANSVIDILAIVKSVGDVVELKSRATGQDLKKRDVLLVDDSNAMVTLSLWGAQAEQFNVSDHPVIAIKAARITEFNGGKFLSTVSSTIIQANPNIPETAGLLQWFNDSNQAQNAKLLSSPSSGLSSMNCPRLNLLQAREMNIGTPGIFNTFTTIATISSIRSQNCVYKACPTEGCKKKLTGPVNGMYRCGKCETDFPNYVYRMIAQATLFDWTEELKVTLFGEEAEKIVGKNAQELGLLQERLSSDNYDEIFMHRAFERFIFKIRMKQETFNNMTKLKACVLSVTPVDKKEYAAFDAFLIKELTTIVKNNSSSDNA